jgi:hypothetical protein
MSEALSAGRLEEIRGRNAARTPGPWLRSGYAIRSGHYDHSVHDHGLIASVEGGLSDGVGGYFNDGEFIANAPQDVTDLLAEVTRLADMNDRIANDRIQDSDLAVEAIRRERQATVALLLAWADDREGLLSLSRTPSAVLRAAAAAIKASLHLEVKR